MERRRTGRPLRSSGALLLLLGSIALAPGCATDFELGDLVSRQQGQLGTAAAAYADNLRWGRVEMAAQLVEPELRPAFLALFRGDAAGVRFTEIEVAHVEVGEKSRTATVRLQARVYRPHLLTEVGVTELQHWRYDRGEGKWFVAPDLSLYERSARPADGRPLGLRRALALGY